MAEHSASVSSRDLAELLIANFDTVNAARDRASKEAGRRCYRSMGENDNG